MRYHSQIPPPHLVTKDFISQNEPISTPPFDSAQGEVGGALRVRSQGAKRKEVIYHQLVDSLIDELNPQGILQEHLVLKIANSLWRYRRVINAETSRINQQLETTADNIQRGYYDSILDEPDDAVPDDESTTRHNADILGSKSVPDHSFRESLQHYEMRLDHQLTRAFRLLHQLHQPTQSESTPHPATKNFFPGNEPISQQLPPID